MWRKFEQYLVETRYSIRDENGNPLEHTYDEILNRIVSYIEERAKEIGWERYLDIAGIKKALKDRKIITATPFLMNAGNEKTRHKGFYSCYPLGPVPDSTVGIMETVLRMVNIYQSAGGVGIDVSSLRPKGALVDNGQGKSSGPVTFLKMFDAVAGTISQGGKRRGALMVQMDWNHPDILEFVRCKRDSSNFNNLNISVNVFGEEFWENKKLIREIAESIWACGDPGLLYIDNMLKYTPLTSKNARYVNPCGEYISEPNTACNLLTVNVSQFAVGNFESEALYYGDLACQLGNLIIELGGFPEELIEKQTKKLRPVGVGITGYHKLLNRLGVSYGESVEIAKRLQANLMIGTMRASAKLSEILPVIKWKKSYCAELMDKAKRYSRYDHVLNDVKEFLAAKGGIPNCLTTVQAPTGSISQLVHVLCTGIEPYFDKKIVRRVRDERQDWIEFELEDPDAKVETVSPQQQIDVLCAFQEFVHASISKTINLPAETTKDEIEELIYYTHKKRLKGLTAFRDSCKPSVLKRKNEGTIDLGKRRGVTYKFNGPTSLYVTANKIDGKLHEVFVICSKPGKELKSLTDGLGRVISVGLQSGTPPSRFARTLEGLEGEIVFNNSAFERPSKSICDAISKVIQAETECNTNTETKKGLCPSCGEWSVVRNGGCKSCTSCGYSSC